MWNLLRWIYSLVAGAPDPPPPDYSTKKILTKNGLLVVIRYDTAAILQQPKAQIQLWTPNESYPLSLIYPDATYYDGYVPAASVEKCLKMLEEPFPFYEINGVIMSPPKRKSPYDPTMLTDPSLVISKSGEWVFRQVRHKKRGTICENTKDLLLASAYIRKTAAMINETEADLCVIVEADFPICIIDLRYRYKIIRRVSDDPEAVVIFNSNKENIYHHSDDFEKIRKNMLASMVV